MEDFVICKNKTGAIQAGGYKINSKIFNSSIEQSQLSGKNNDKVSSLFKDLGVPAGLLFLENSPPTENTFRKEKGDYISSELYENLLKLVQQDVPRNRNTKNRNTKKQKIKKKHRKNNTKKHKL